YADIARSYHRALASLGIGCNIVGWHQDFSAYKLLLFPPQYLIEADHAKKVTEYVAKGGHVVSCTRMGIMNYHCAAHPEPAPALLRELLGIEIEESDVLGERTNSVKLASGERFEASSWCDVLELKDAQVLGVFEKEFYKDKPAVTVHAHGKGKAYYVG